MFLCEKILKFLSLVQLLHTAHESTSDVDGLHAKIDRKKAVETKNETTQLTFQERFSQNIGKMNESLADFVGEQGTTTTTLHDNLGNLKKYSWMRNSGSFIDESKYLEEFC